MDKKQAQNYRDRWQAVEDIRQMEARGATTELHWRQINATYGLARSLPLAVAASDELLVHERWAKLKANLP